MLFTLLGAATKELSTYWQDWFVGWGIIFGIFGAIVVGMFLLLDRNPRDEIF